MRATAPLRDSLVVGPRPEGRRERSAVSAHLRSMVCREVSSASGAAMTVAPSWPRSFPLQSGGGEWVVEEKLTTINGLSVQKGHEAGSKAA